MYLIFGTGKVGSAVMALCLRQNISYEICDDETPPNSYDDYEFIIPSPGIPETHPIYATGRVMCELDFAYQFLPRDFQIISVTGTDGKSTTSWIMYSILEREFSVKKSVYLSGNFDIPFSATVLGILEKGEKEGIIIVEISSFMAYAIEKYESDYSIFTNLKPDHLNWHTSLQGYVDAKMNLMKHTTKRSIINKQVIEFVRVNRLMMQLPENIRIFSIDSSLQDSTDGEDLGVAGQREYQLTETNFSGVHNAMNILACTIVADEIGIPHENTRKYLKDVEGLPHRLEIVGTRGGITIVEDSKSTSSQSLAAALGSFGTTRNLLLIVGGSDKGDNFTSLTPLFSTRVRALVCIGATKQAFIDIAQQEDITYLATDILEDGVDWLYAQRCQGDVLMMSPGCASFGLFRDYLDRAEQFRHTIQKLPIN
ncbi:UDP-N-acetylmuramoyl-L-alanine--D-glutamate ligase [Candidatus Gracilibacteria bacterium]|nr:UDP-N-acetylmuramoyl-L-alanine--D-glutamate ligase [Candidatus Gracilibacteria bacterium]